MSKQTKPVISVIIQTRETPFMILKRCIQCVREQTYQALEILLLDSNEPDSPYKEAILAAPDLLTDILHLEIPEKKEFVQGKNAALEACHGDYITFLSAQDILYPKRLEKIMNAFEDNHSYFALYTDMTVQQNNILENSDYDLHSGEFAYLSQLVFHRDCFRCTGNFDPDLVAHCDDDLWFRLRSLKLANHIPDEECIISVCPDTYHGYSAVEAAIGYRQLAIKYATVYKKDKKGRRELYQNAAIQYKKAHVFHRYLQFRIKAMFTK